MSQEDINAEVILDHYRNPHNHGRLANPTFSITEYNPVCGDTVHMEILVSNGEISDIRFVGTGCSISQGSASFLTDLVKGKAIPGVMELTPEVYLRELGLNLGPAREKCALLSLNAVRKAISGNSQK